jgi:hypothetical protein
MNGGASVRQSVMLGWSERIYIIYSFFSTYNENHLYSFFSTYNAVFGLIFLPIR